MLEDRLSSSLLNSGYQRVNSNAQGIYLFYHTTGQELTVVSVIHAMNGQELIPEQYQNVLEQIKGNFRQPFPPHPKLLSLILTDQSEKVKHLAIESNEDSHWIIDIRTNRLIIYENQSGEFDWHQKLIEQLLTQEQTQAQNIGATPQPGYRYEESNSQGSLHNRRMAGRYQLTPVTTVIIAVNVIAFLFTHYFTFFGSQELLLEKGALSWYYVTQEKEFYRILTSMFMHADWNHLFSNMLVLLFVGGNLERAVGKIKYLFIYFGAGIIAGTSSIGYNMWKEYANASYDNITISVGASGAIFGIVGAILFVVIINKGRLEEISTGQMVLFVILSLYSGIVNSQIDQAAHVGGFIAGILLAVVVYRKPKDRMRKQQE